MSFTDTEYSRALSIINDLRVEKDKLRAELSAALKLADEATALLYRDAKKHEAQLERAQAQCAEMRSQLVKTEFGDLHGYDRQLHCFDCQLTRKDGHHAKCGYVKSLSTDCGKGFLSPDKVRVVREALQYCADYPSHGSFSFVDKAKAAISALLGGGV